MRVFVTGATGFVGSAVVQELLTAGHQVLGLVRSEASADKLSKTGAEVLRGNLSDLDSLRTGVAETDGVIHTAMNHDFSQFAANCAEEKLAVETMGAALQGSDRPFLVTSGVAILSPGQVSTEAIPPKPPTQFPRASEWVAAQLAERGVNASIIRLPPSTHGAGDYGFVPILVKIAREKGLAAYIGEGANRWPAAHRTDAAVLYRLALEKAARGARYHVIAEEGVPFKQIAESIGAGLNLPVQSLTPEEAQAHFGWFAMFTGLDCPSSSQQTRETLGWTPTHPGLIADMDEHYFKV